MAVTGNVVGIADVELGAHHAVHTALVVDEAAWAKLGQGQKARPTDHAAFVVLAIRSLTATGGNPGHQRQAREVVAG
ncbi:hypothetical protein D3C85_1241040 [compost metagenome]